MSTFFIHSHWQLAGHEQGLELIHGVDDIYLCIDNIISTRKGSDVLRPQFGSDHYDYIDQPFDIAIPNFVREIHSAIERWEKRVLIEKINVSGSAPHFVFEVFFYLRDDIARDLYRTAVRT